MKKTAWIGFFAIWTGFSPGGSAQVSSFPAAPTIPQQDSGATNGPTSAFPSSPPASAAGDASAPVASSTPGMEATPSPESSAAPAGGPAGADGATSTASPTNTPSHDTTPISASTLNSMEVLDDKVPLEAGDGISFRVIEDRDDAVPRIVTDTGEVDFPYVGRLKVAGLTCLQVARQLKKLLEVDYYKRATVIVGLDTIVGHTKDTVQDVAWIVGQVHQVGPQELSKLRPLTVSQLILRAGGFGDFADQRKVRLVHRVATPPSASGTAVGTETPDNSTPEGQLVDIKSVFEGHSGFDPVVQPNDLIIVPKRLINF